MLEPHEQFHKKFTLLSYLHLNCHILGVNLQIQLLCTGKTHNKQGLTRKCIIILQLIKVIDK